MKIFLIFFALLFCVSGKPTLYILRDLLKDILQIPDAPKTHDPVAIQTIHSTYPPPYAYNTPENYQFQNYPCERAELRPVPPPSGPAGIYDNNLYIQDPPLQIDVRSRI